MPDQISMKRWNSRSTRPPRKPWIAPAAMPITEEIAVRVKPNSTEMRNP